MAIKMFFFHIWGEIEGCNETTPYGITLIVDF